MKPNPFPGMNPWLEQHWGDVHTRLTTYASDMLQPSLPSGLRARVEEYVTVQQDLDENNGDNDELRFSPNLRIVQRPWSEQVSGGIASTTIAPEKAFADPIIIPIAFEPLTHRRLQIIDTRSRNRIVTSIEFLSPTNKRNGADDFVRKQHLMLRGGTHIVEIDLLRGDSWYSTVDSDFIPKSRRTPYRVCVITAQRPNYAAAYAIPLRQALPAIPIPLRPTDEEVPLNLQALIDQAYINGGYEDLDYTQPPKPPLNESDAQWAAEILKENALL